MIQVKGQILVIIHGKYNNNNNYSTAAAASYYYIACCAFGVRQYYYMKICYICLNYINTLQYIPVYRHIGRKGERKREWERYVFKKSI